jgi:hypothetical protein
MNLRSTLFLKGVLVLMALIVLGICGYILPEALSNEQVGDYRAIVIVMCVAAIPFLFALYQAFQLLTYIDKSRAFSDLSIKALRNIKYCALTIAGLFIIGIPVVLPVAEADDAPGAVGIILVIALASIVVAVFAALLQKLMQTGLEIKSENDLTV